jgi:Fe-S cluster assembly iron-binding protein IscA
LAGVHVTPSACEALSKLLARRTGADRCLRLNTNQGNYRFIIDEPIEHDIVYRHDDQVVLVVSETVARDLWGITVDTASSDDGKQKLIFRKAKAGEPLETVRDDAPMVPPEWRAEQHAQLLNEIAEIGKQIQSLRGSTKSMVRDQLQALEAARQEKWDAIRAIWAGDGGWHKLNGLGASTGVRQPETK